ncbi:MAG: amidohydrolase family protein [Acidobacteriaceae bacterium]|nr:amidohydrolase family protein [Acidobacteriaceae bacterium]
MRQGITLHFVGWTSIAVAVAIAAQSSGDTAATFSPAQLQAFTAIEPIDAHAHVVKVDPEFYTFLHRLHLRLVDIVVANREDAEFPTLESKIAAAQAFVNGSNGKAVLCTTFDPFHFSDRDFATNAVRQLNRDFARGAVAVKIWKNVGMELKDQSGKFVMPDDFRLEPIYKDIAAHGKTLIAHLAEPDSCWQPPNKNSPDYRYYSQHPEWYMYNQPDHPRKATIIEARDHILEQNPELRVVGAHLGSLETNLDEIAQRLDRYSNFAVDTAARVIYLAMQPREKARQFLIKYQDRILYGTDLSLSAGQNTQTAINAWQRRYATDWAFFSSEAIVQYQGRKAQGLNLPPEVLRKLYHDNAVHWIPGVVPSPSSP